MQLLVGFRKFDYTSKKTGEVVTGCNLYLESPDTKNVNGIATDTVFIRWDKVSSILEGNKLPFAVTILYNKYGGIERIETC